MVHFLATAQQKMIKLHGTCYLCVFDTLGVIEGMFSNAGQITAGRRNTLSPVKANSFFLEGTETVYGDILAAVHLLVFTERSKSTPNFILLKKQNFIPK